MKDVKEACKTLGIPVSASAEEAEAAYRELMLVWDPERFPDAPEIQEKAGHKRLLIQQAFDYLNEHRSEENTSRDSWPGGLSGSRQPGSGPSAEMSASLYEDIFSEKSRPKRKLPLYAVVLSAAIVLLIVAALFVPWGGGSAFPPEEAQTPGIQEQANRESPLPEVTVSDSGGESVTAGQQSEPPSFEEEETAQAGPVATEPPAVPPPAVPPPVPTPPAEPLAKPASGEASRQEPTEERSTASEDRREAVRPDSGKSTEEEPAHAAEERAQEAASQAFELLKQTSLAAAKLVIGEVEDMAFQEWKPVQVDGQKVLLDLVAFEISDSQELHCIWQVDLESGKVTALSQAARDLEARLRPR